MSDDLMLDEARQRFENQNFPESITPFYIGHMSNHCSLPRIAMGYSAPNLPIKQTSLDVSNILLEEMNPPSHYNTPDLQGAIMGHKYRSTYELSENISALRMNYLFFDAFGKTIGEHYYSLVMDIPKGDWKNDDMYCYHNKVTELCAINSNVNIIEGMEAKNFHLCLFGISAARTTDGVLFEQDTEDFIAMTNWAIPPASA